MSTYAVVNPATGETIKEYPEISDAELRSAIDRADEASRTWSRSSSVTERAASVRKVGELHHERRQQLAEIIVREMGKPIEQALMEVDFAGEIYAFYADNAEGLMAGDAHPEDDEDIDFRLVKLSEIVEMIEKGAIKDGKTLCSVLLYARRVAKKRKK